MFFTPLYFQSKSSLWSLSVLGLGELDVSDDLLNQLVQSKASPVLLRTSKLLVACALLLIPSLLKAQLSTIRKSASLSGNTYRSEKGASLSELSGSLNHKANEVSGIAPLPKQDIKAASTASAQTSGSPNIGFRATQPTPVFTPASRVVRACTTLIIPGNLVYNPSFTAFSFFDAEKLTEQPSLSVTANSPACNWELMSPAITPDLWYKYAIPTQPDLCYYSCTGTAVPQSRWGATLLPTDPTQPNAEDGAIGLESDSNYRESYVQKLSQPLEKGVYYASFKLGGLVPVNCGPCTTGSGGNSTFYGSYANGLGLSISSFKPAFASPEIPNGRTVTGGYYHDDLNRPIVNQIEIDRTGSPRRRVFRDWRLVSGKFSYDQGSNPETYLTIGNYQEAGLTGFSSTPEYHLVDQIELYRFPYLEDFTVCVNQSVVNQPLAVIGNLPASASAQYEWSSPDPSISFSNPNTLLTSISVPATATGTRLVILKTTTRAYSGDSTLPDGYVFRNQITYDTAIVSIQACAPCSAVSGANISSDKESVCQGDGIELRATGSTSATGIHHQWQTSDDGGLSWVNLSPTDTLLTAALSSSAITGTSVLVRLQSTCRISNTSALSNTLTISKNTPAECICAPIQNGCNNSDKIQSFTVNNGYSLSVPSSCHGNFYAYFTLSGPTDTLRINPGGVYRTKTVTGSNKLKGSLWIDYNQDYTFQSNEWINLGDSLTTAGVDSSLLSIPASALPGVTRARIRTRRADEPNDSTMACDAYSSGHTYDFPIVVSTTVSLSNKHSHNAVVIYPNPTTHQLTLQGLPAEVTEVEVVDGIGRHATLHVQNAQVTVSHLASGLYRMRITTATGVQTLNFVKQ